MHNSDVIGRYEELLVGIEATSQDYSVGKIVDSAKDRSIALVATFFERLYSISHKFICDRSFEFGFN